MEQFDELKEIEAIIEKAKIKKTDPQVEQALKIAKAETDENAVQIKREYCGKPAKADKTSTLKNPKKNKKGTK